MWDFIHVGMPMQAIVIPAIRKTLQHVHCLAVELSQTSCVLADVGTMARVCKSNSYLMTRLHLAKLGVTGSSIGQVIVTLFLC